MKRLLTLSALALLLGVFNALPCSIPDQISLTLQPNSTNYVYWDFTDCGIGVQNFGIHVQESVTKALSNGTPLTIDAVNVVTGEVAIHESKYILFFPQYGANQGLIQLSLVYTGRKPQNVFIYYTGGLGGPP